MSIFRGDRLASCRQGQRSGDDLGSVVKKNKNTQANSSAHENWTLQAFLTARARRQGRVFVRQTDKKRLHVFREPFRVAPLYCLSPSPCVSVRWKWAERAKNVAEDPPEGRKMSLTFAEWSLVLCLYWTRFRINVVQQREDCVRKHNLSVRSRVQCRRRVKKMQKWWLCNCWRLGVAPFVRSGFNLKQQNMKN